MTVDPIVITADEINCLIYAYFQDAGFNHSAFALRNEGRLQDSPFFSKHIPRGELIELLSKALLYLEVESHWRNDQLATNCKAGFSLLEPHVCSLEDTPPVENMVTVETNGVKHATNRTATSTKNVSVTSNGVRSTASPAPESLPMYEQVLVRQVQALAPLTDGSAKRKTSPIPVDGPAGKRVKRSPDEADQHGYYHMSPARSPVQQTHEAEWYQPPAKQRAQGPGDKTDPRVVLLLPGHKSEVFVPVFNPQTPNQLASGSKDGTVILWDLPNPPPPDSDTFASPPGEPIIMRNVSKGAQGDITSLSWNPEGTLLAMGCYDSILRMCTNAGSVYFTHPQHEGPVFATKFSKSGMWLLTASLDGTSCVWDVKERRLLKQYRCHKDCCLDIEWINDTTFASAGADGRIYILRIDEDEPIKTFNGHKDEVNQIRVNPSGTRLASCSDDGTAYIWKVDNLSGAADAIPGLTASDHVVVLKGHSHSVSTVGWCADRPPGTNELVATSSFDGTARIWDAVTGQCLHSFNDHTRPVYTLTFSPDGKFFATGSGDGWLHIYHTRTYERIWSWFAGQDQPGVFELDWQTRNGLNRIAMALECHQVAVLDVNKVEAFRAFTQNTADKKGGS